MTTIRCVLVLSCSLAAGGCTNIGNLAANGSYAVAAADLDTSKPGPDNNQEGGLASDARLEGSNTYPHKKDYVWRLVSQSEENCNAFMNGLVAAEAGTQTSLDLATTIATALGTAFTPISTAHAFAAAGSITSGWKTAIDSDIFAKATLANYSQAIQATYYKSLQDYATKLDAMDESKVSIPEETVKIRAMNSQCSLAAAQASISSTLQASSSTPSSSTTNLEVVGASARAHTLTLTATWNGKSISSTTRIAAGDDQTVIATKLAGAVNSNSGLQADGITAAINAGSNTSVTLQTPQSLQVAWTIRGQNGESIALSPANTTVPIPGAKIQ